LLLIWSVLLLGVTWRVLNHVWSALRRRLPGKTLPVVQVLHPQRPRLSVSIAPRLVANNPERYLSEAPLPLLLPPQDDLSQHKLTIVIFQPHNEETTL
jgi:hypothetical protein